MRLLNTETYKVVEFYTDIPLYAILSHTWGKEEVTFQDIQNLEAAKTKTGWLKVKNSCKHARKYTFDWIWIDACCIDRSSSAELSEALNSMYQYYTDAEVCYVYLSDVSSKENPRDPRSSFRSSQWFTRGWTLQELLAPMYAVFLDTDWKEIGTRWSLRDAISAITTIPIKIFKGQKQIDDFSIAQKMSWAASRETTRPEDEAYCLLGIFNVNMPPIYGEGRAKAFMRLQQEIIKISDDRSIFAWVSESSLEVRGLLARSPKEFCASGQVVMPNAELIGNKSSFSFGNNGLHIHLPLIHAGNSGTGDLVFLAPLHCTSQGIAGDNYLAIYLAKIGEQQYVRCHADEIIVINFQIEDLREVVVKEHPLPRRIRRKDGAIDYNGSMNKASFELSPSAQCLFSLGDHNRKQKPAVKSSTIFVQLQYSSEGKDEEVYCMFEAQTPEINTTVERVGVLVIKEFLDGQQLLTIPWDISDGSPVDRVQCCLKGGLLHVCLHMGSRQRKIEIDYKPLEDCTGDQQIILLQSPSWNCIVPSKVPHPLWTESFLFESITPPNFFDHDLNMACDTNTPRLLTYQLGDKRYHVAVGFHESGGAWTDIFLSQQEATDVNVSNYQDLWKSYLDSGNWKTKQASASIELEVLNGSLSRKCQLTATVTNVQNAALKLWSHVLLIQAERIYAY